MCVIIAGTNKKPSLEVLQACEKANGHGAGIAWVTRKGDVVYVKGTKPEGMHALLSKLNDGRPWAVHFRLATVGGQVDELTHPFPVLDGVPLQKDGRAPKVLFHNGHWSDWQEHGLREVLRWGVKPLAGHISDSRVVAMLVHHYGEDVLGLIPGKYILLDKEGFRIWPYAKTDWHEIDGCWYSNQNWKGRLPSSTPTTSQVGPYQGNGCGYGQYDYRKPTLPPGQYPQFTDFDRAYARRDEWLNKLKQAGYTEKEGVWSRPKPAPVIIIPDTDTEAGPEPGEEQLTLGGCAD